MSRHDFDPRTRARMPLPTWIAALLAAAGPAIAAAATNQAALPLGSGASPWSGRLPPARSGPPAPALASGATVPVTSCADDKGFDTLRHAVLVANPGDTVDMSALSCSKITLLQGAISIPVSDLRIAGPGAQKLTIDGNKADRVFKHDGTGTLTLDDVTIANGKVVADSAVGGCIYALKGGVSLHRSVVTSCAAIGQTMGIGGAIAAYATVYAGDSTISQNQVYATGGADGLNCAAGAIFATYKLQLIRSVMSGNSAHAPAGKVYAGASFSGSLSVKYSTISGNSAIGAGDAQNSSYSLAGATVSGADTQVIGSTIDNNTADAAGAMLFLDSGAGTVSISQTTISSNTGILGVGAFSSLPAVSIANSTIAFNASGSVVPVSLQLNAPVDLQSTIIADNSPVDIAAGAVTGSHNLVKTASAGTLLPPDTIKLDPKLGPLDFNGGTTRTHALAAQSPALNAGANASGFPTDQRGPTFRRVVGPAADIGAYEVDSDHIFGSGFGNPDE